MAGNAGAWVMVLEGVALSGGAAATGVGCLTKPPDGLGLPGLRTEDVTFPQRDGAKHFADWYLPRIVTAEDVTVCNDGCPGCPSARVKTRQIMSAWGRKCDDVELVIFTDCHDPDAEDRSLTGPFGVIGRPRVAEVTHASSDVGCMSLLLRFDAVDHRIYVLDATGEPGSGVQCVTIDPDVSLFCRDYPRCYSPSGGDGMCYDNNISPSGGSGPQTVTVGGTLCIRPTIVLTGPLTNPVVENITSGQSLTYGAIIPSGQTITIDLSEGTATDSSGNSRTYLLSGDTRMEFIVGDNSVRLTSYGSTDTGTAEVCWRDQVDWI